MLKMLAAIVADASTIHFHDIYIQTFPFVAESMGSEASCTTGFLTQVFPVVWPWAAYLKLLCLGDFICKLEIMTVPTLEDYLDDWIS